MYHILRTERWKGKDTMKVESKSKTNRRVLSDSYAHTEATAADCNTALKASHSILSHSYRYSHTSGTDTQSNFSILDLDGQPETA